MAVAETLETAPTCACGAPIYAHGGTCHRCEALASPWGQRTLVLWDRLLEEGLTEISPEPWASWCRGEVARVALMEGGLLRELARVALAHCESHIPTVLTMEEGRLMIYVRGPDHDDREEIGIPGTLQVDEWVDGDPVRAAAVEKTAAYHVPTGEPWESGPLPDALAWRAFMAAAGAFGGEHPTYLQEVPWAGREGLRQLLEEGQPLGPWASSDYSASIRLEPVDPGAWRGWGAGYGMAELGERPSQPLPVLALEYGQGRSLARLEFLPSGMARVVCTAAFSFLWVGDQPPTALPEEVADCWRSVRDRAFAAISVIRSAR